MIQDDISYSVNYTPDTPESIYTHHGMINYTNLISVLDSSFSTEKTFEYYYSEKHSQKFDILKKFIIETMGKLDFKIIFSDSLCERGSYKENVFLFIHEQKHRVCIFMTPNVLKIKISTIVSDNPISIDDSEKLINQLDSTSESIFTLIKEFIDNAINEKDENEIVIAYCIATREGTKSIPVKVRKINFAKEYYPSVVSADKMLDDYFESSSNVLLLYGSPGTGKTTFIRYIIEHFYNKFFNNEDDQYMPYERVITTKNPDVLYDDTTFLEFINSSLAGLFIIEDADTMMKSRADGNEFMKTLLNFSDGIFTMNDKKIILTTNLEHTENIDPALLRPGRCFDSIHFRKFSKIDAGIAFPTLINKLKKEEYTLAELFKKLDIENKKIGG